MLKKSYLEAYVQVLGQYKISDNCLEFHKFQQVVATDAALLPVFAEYLHSSRWQFFLKKQIIDNFTTLHVKQRQEENIKHDN